jgi:hypothetical protein
VVTDDHAEVILYHRHPDGDVKTPHLHLGSSQLRRDAVAESHDHIPSGRVSLEQVVWFLITQQDIVAARTNWQQVLRENDAKFVKWWTWH